MFRRSNNTYDFDPKIIEHILKDEANPLNRICQLIPNGSKVLDIGAGNGLFALVLLKSRVNIVIDGIEPNTYAADLAKEHYRFFHVGYAQEFKGTILKEGYDFIVLADVIEHINDPQDFLTELCSGLSEQTKTILSVPNVAFGAVRLALLNGEFNYVDSGILEKTHIRFFTQKTIETLISKINMNIEKLYFLQRNIFSTEIKLDKNNLNSYCLSKLLEDDLASTYQFILVLNAKKVLTEKKYFGQTTKLLITRKHKIIHRILRRLRVNLQLERILLP